MTPVVADTPLFPPPAAERPRTADGTRYAEHPDTAQRDEEVRRRIEQGQTFRAVAADLGYCSPASTFTAYRRALARRGEQPTRRTCPTCGHARASHTTAA